MILPWVGSALRGAGLAIDPQSISRYHSWKLRDVYKHAIANSNFYIERFKGSASPPEDPPFKDWLAKIPFTTAKDIVDRPYWFLGLSQSEILRSYVVDMDDGKYKQIFYSREELDHIVQAIAAFFGTIGVGPSTGVAIVFPQENEWGIPDLISRAVRARGGNATLIDDADLEAQTSHIVSLRSEVIVGSAQQLFYMSALFPRDLGGYKPKAMVPCHGCVPYLFTERAKRLVRESWQTSIYEHFGITEMGFNVAIGCDNGEWLHINEADVYAEVVDSENLCPLEEGMKGELVLTNLASRAMPLMRYRTGYIATLLQPGCPCGDKLTRRLKIHSSTDSSSLLSQPLVFRPF